MELTERYPQLECSVEEINAAADMLVNCFRSGNKLLLCGNGGSCSDCEHIVGELMKGFLKKRPLSENIKKAMKLRCPEIPDIFLDKLQGGLPAISLPSFSALDTAFYNDVSPELNFAQAVIGLGKADDILMCISTSGNSSNVTAAAITAKAAGLKVIALTGTTGGKLRSIADICIRVPEIETFKVQELHLPIYHYLCSYTESNFFET